MSAGDRGTNPFDRLREHFSDIEMRCPECGYEDEESAWTSTTDGSEIRYQHVCSNCGKVRMRSVTIPE